MPINSLAKHLNFFDVDVVIVNYNAGTLLVDCVRSAFTGGAALVIVVDNDSTDGSLENLDRAIASERLLVIRNAKNLGFAAACNIGIHRSHAGHILFLNPDSVLTNDALGTMIRASQSAATTGMVSGILCNLDGSEQPGGRRIFPTPRRAFVRAFGLSRLQTYFPTIFSDFLLHNEPLPKEQVAVEAISGACMLVKRKAIDDVGLWDEGYFLHCEDLDWCMRFQRNGWKVVFTPDAKIIHVKGASSRSRPIFVEWHKHRGMVRFYRKFFRHQYTGLLWGLVIIGVWLRFVLVALYLSARLALANIRAAHA